MSKKIDLTGQQFGFLTVIKEAPPKIYILKSGSSGRFYQWLCQCICDKTIITTTSKLKSKSQPTISCGCKHFTNLDHGNSKYKDPKMVSFNALIKRYRMSCVHKNNEWQITDEHAIKLFLSNCFYCGAAPHNTYNVYITKQGKYNTKNKERADMAEILFNGIDRKNNDLGYTTSNTVSCCARCNYSKLNISIEEFYEWLDRISAYHIGNKK